MEKFVKRIAVFLIFPLFVGACLVLIYLKHDVYLDFGHHNNYSWKYNFQQLGDISTKKLLASKGKYNSFIFGSSRTVSIYACYLQTKIEDSRFFHYANWNETIGGIYAKLKLLDTLGYSIENVMICLDTDYTFADNGRCRTYDHYLLTGVSRFDYYAYHFQNIVLSLDKSKAKILFGYEVSGEVFPNWESDPVTNDPQHICSDSIINNYGVVGFGKGHLKKIDSLKQAGILYMRSKVQRYKEDQISPEEANTLINIRRVLDKHSTNFFIIINPLYDQLKFSTSDIQLIRKVFGHNVYDFSGINKYTDNENNYPDGKHFMPYISKEIIDSIVSKQN